jgi:phage terminase large subunit-like protein
MGDIIEEAEGALWSRKTIEACYARDRQPPDMRRIVVAVDPATTSKATSNLTGIVVAGVGADGLGYVLADISGRYTPDEWGKIAVKAYQDFRADSIVAEGNQGGEMVVFTIKTVNENVPVKIVHASRSKQARAEPVAALYEQGRVKHTQTFPEMEDQMCTWEPLSGDPSPDRLDAVVWAITNLMLTETAIPFVVPFVTGNVRNIPGQHTPQPSSPYRGW